jgi:hypothetical protein
MEMGKVPQIQKTGSHYVAQAGLKLAILLLPATWLMGVERYSMEIPSLAWISGHMEALQSTLLPGQLTAGSCQALVM